MLREEELLLAADEESSFCWQEHWKEYPQIHRPRPASQRIISAVHSWSRRKNQRILGDVLGYQSGVKKRRSVVQHRVLKTMQGQHRERDKLGRRKGGRRNGGRTSSRGDGLEERNGGRTGVYVADEKKAGLPAGLHSGIQNHQQRHGPNDGTQARYRDMDVSASGRGQIQDLPASRICSSLQSLQAPPGRQGFAHGAQVRSGGF